MWTEYPSMITSYLLTYSLTPWCRTLFEKLTVTQLVKNILLSLWNPRFIIVFTKARHFFLSSARCTPSTSPHPVSLQSILILPSPLRLNLPSSLFLWGFSTKIVYALLISSTRTTCPTHLILLDTMTSAKNYQGDQIKEDEMGGACSMHGRHEKFIQNFGWKTWGKRTLERTQT